ncbi:MAG: hypothetical protein JSU94_03500 [Phycisphaerales bacterium]|nr:MAG: hypothetical protein JSU94_03500 [Phycisphaerales bacterium]
MFTVPISVSLNAIPELGDRCETGEIAFVVGLFDEGAEAIYMCSELVNLLLQLAGSWPGRGGGAMKNWESSPTLKNCTFRDNSAGWGGGGINNVGKKSRPPDVSLISIAMNEGDWHRAVAFASRPKSDQETD